MNRGMSNVYVNLTSQVMMWLSDQPMSLEELAEKTGVEKKKVYLVLSSLHRSKRIAHFRDDDGVRRYRPLARDTYLSGYTRLLEPSIRERDKKRVY